MSWADWVSSTYNTIGIRIFGSGEEKYIVDSDYCKIQLNGAEVLANSTIKSGENYISVVHFALENRSYNAVKGMTWREWIASEYNTPELKLIDDTYVADSQDCKLRMDNVDIQASNSIVNFGYYNFIIEFSIDSVNYIADKGSTWSAWLTSDYNTDGLTSDGINVVDSNSCLIKYNGTNVVPSAEIVAKSNYVTIIHFTIGITRYYSEKGMTWREWIASEYNTPEFRLLDDTYVVDLLDCKLQLDMTEVTANNSVLFRGTYLIVITFSIDSVTYKADKDSTWIAWIYSNYNTDSYALSDDENYIVDTDGAFVSLASQKVSSTAKIELANDYILTINFNYTELGEYNSQTLIATKGMTWRNWVASNYNTLGFVVAEDETIIYTNETKDSKLQYYDEDVSADSPIVANRNYSEGEIPVESSITYIVVILSNTNRDADDDIWLIKDDESEIYITNSTVGTFTDIKAIKFDCCDGSFSIYFNNEEIGNTSWNDGYIYELTCDIELSYTRGSGFYLKPLSIIGTWQFNDILDISTDISFGENYYSSNSTIIGSQNYFNSLRNVAGISVNSVSGLVKTQHANMNSSNIFYYSSSGWDDTSAKTITFNSNAINATNYEMFFTWLKANAIKKS